MRPKYKKVMVAMPHCPQCGEMLEGDNSAISTWRCACGKWVSRFIDPWNYVIEPKTSNEEEE